MVSAVKLGNDLVVCFPFAFTELFQCQYQKVGEL